MESYQNSASGVKPEPSLCGNTIILPGDGFLLKLPYGSVAHAYHCQKCKDALFIAKAEAAGIARAAAEAAAEQKERDDRRRDFDRRKSEERAAKAAKAAEKARKIPGVYVIESPDGLYKVGCSAHAPKRVSSIISAIPHRVKHIHTIETSDPYAAERFLHQLFKGMRVKGEWFRLPPHDVAWLKSLHSFEDGQFH